MICPVHGAFKQLGYNHLKGCGCPYCTVGLPMSYKFNLLKEFEDEYAFRAFLENGDSYILYEILRNVEPKYEPLKKDIERALASSGDINPIEYLEHKYSSGVEENDDEEPATVGIDGSDLDDDDAVSELMNATTDHDETDETITIDDVVWSQNREREIGVINRIEHLLTPETREYIMKRFLNNNRRAWIAQRENK